MHIQDSIPSPNPWPCAAVLALGLVGLCACGTSVPATDRSAAVDVHPGPGWVLVHHEDFEDPAVLGMSFPIACPQPARLDPPPTA